METKGHLQLPIFRAGSPLVDQLTAKNLNAICRAIEQLRLTNGLNTRARVSATGQSVDVSFPIVPRVLAPWEVTVSDITIVSGSATGVKVQINPNSTLLLSDDLDDIYDFGTSLTDTYTLEFDHCLWLQLNFGSDGAFSTASIESGDPATNDWSTWGTTKRCWELLGDYPDDKSQTLWVMLASLTTVDEADPRAIATFSGGTVVLTTYVNTHLRLTRKCADTAGRETIRWVEPSWRGYPGGVA